MTGLDKLIETTYSDLGVPSDKSEWRRVESKPRDSFKTGAGE
jgi:hypothetical protein